ncbi:protein phosphatase 2C domain-containing protein [Pontiella sp.]|uniref:protein kinase domain-containing protein n=1 Tax=Pontiella sp. TaxID=2837462 RepID=UPI0035653BAF
MFHLDGKIELTAGRTTSAGRKASNDDAVAVHIPDDNLLTTHKGITAIISDGVSSADAGAEASALCTRRFISDYYTTPDIWTVKHSAQNVLTTLNRELYNRGKSYRDAGKGFVCTLSLVVFKSHTAHIFHIGDTRIYRLRDGRLKQLTDDHNLQINAETSYLARAMGLDREARIDYSTTDTRAGDLFVLTTDGLHENIDEPRIVTLLESNRDDPQKACDMLVDEAYAMNSRDNISCVVLHITGLPENSREEIDHRLTQLPFPPPLKAGQTLDGYEVLREVHASSRSQVYHVRDPQSGQEFAMKTPSPNFEDDDAYIERFIMESWIGARIDCPNVARVVEQQRPRSRLYYLSEWVEGIPLSRWEEENHHPQMQTVRVIAQQLVKGLRALHRKEVLHQDLKPDNIVIDSHHRVKIIDFGSCRVAGFEEICGPIERDLILGTVDYSAPEYQLRLPAGSWSDLFSLGCILYFLLTGEHPYGPKFSKCRKLAEFARLKYRPAYHFNPDVPVWVDGALEKSVKVNPPDRYEAHSKFMADLNRPNPDFAEKNRIPLLERNPLIFWKSLCGILAAVIIALLLLLANG